METFQDIHLDLSKQAGRLRIADYGMGWKPVSGSNGLSLEPTAINQCYWSKTARGYEMRILSRQQGVIQLDGFQQTVSTGHQAFLMSGVARLCYRF